LGKSGDIDNYKFYAQTTEKNASADIDVTKIITQSGLIWATALAVDAASYQPTSTDNGVTTTVTVTGKITYQYGTTPTDYDGTTEIVNLTVQNQNSATDQSPTVTIGADGSFSKAFNLPNAAEVGTWTVLANYSHNGDSVSQGSTTFKVNLAISSITYQSYQNDNTSNSKNTVDTGDLNMGAPVYVEAFPFNNPDSAAISGVLKWNNTGGTTAMSYDAGNNKLYLQTTAPTGAGNAGATSLHIQGTAQNSTDVSSTYSGYSDQAITLATTLNTANIWHSKLTSDTSEYSQFFIGADNCQIKTQITNVRSEVVANKSVTTYVYDPDSNEDTNWSAGTTGSDGWTSFHKYTPGPPAGVWTLKSNVSDSDGNSGTGQETVSFISPYTAKYGIQTIGWNDEYHLGDTATFTIQTLEKDADDVWQIKVPDSTPTYSIRYWSGSAWTDVITTSDMALLGEAANATYQATWNIPSASSWLSYPLAITFNAKLGGAQIAELKEFDVVATAEGLVDPIKVEVNPIIANPNESVSVVIHEALTTGEVRTGNAAGTYVYIYDNDNTTVINGANPTERGNGVYTYSYSLGASPEVGNWRVLVTTTLDSLTVSGSTGFYVESDTVASIYSTVQDIQTDVSYIRTQIDSLHTKVDTIDTNVDTLISKWGSYSASDIVGYVDEIESRLGDNADTCAADDTVFGNIQCVRDKWGTQTADTIYTAANNAYTTIQEVQTELGYNGKTDSAYDDIQTLKGYVDTVESGISDLDSDLAAHESAQATERTAQAASRTKVEDIQTRVTAVQSDVSTIKSDVSTIKSDVSSAKSTIDSVWSRLQTLTGTLPSGYTGVYEQLVSIANTLSGLGVLKGSGAESLYTLSAENKNDVKYLKNKILDLQAAIEINRILLASGGQNSVFSTWYTFHSVVLNMLVANPTNRKAKIPFKAYLPKEAKPEHIISSGGLKVEFEEASGSYIVTGEFELEGGQSITRKVEMKNIWLIDEGEVEELRRQAEELAEEAKKTAYSAQVTVLKNDTFMRIERILRKQEEATATPQDHILAYRENLEDLEVVKENLKKMTDLVTSAGAGRGLLGSIASINTLATWGIIIALVTGLVLLGLTFYSMWKHQMMIAAQLAGKKIKGKTTGLMTIEAGMPSLIVLPKIDWQKVLSLIKKILLLGAIGLVVFGVIKGIIFFKPWGKLKKEEQPAVMAPVESEKETTPSPSPSPTPKPEKVVILETETGWLNVREGPGVSFEKVTKVDVGEEFIELERKENEAGEEWVKIQVEEKTVGWVFGEYVKKISNKSND